MRLGIIVSAASAVLLALAVPAMASELSNCAYKGNVSGKTATILVQGGQPVSYKWGSYKAKNVSMTGNVISIDQAVIENLKVGATQSGKAAFQGKWQFKGQGQDVTFICG
ncbi:hypothetical protein [Sulfitobacter guttiformis]|uniref:Uncharacterized protein n=1 Tax=Sulfitobacter guttiformis TaxID=74349 RepID=A0A420DUG7_9RHOB|nr:hypothetical protein [Sulfitobacter guttiformis]RKE97885.1 hypothetical protein C8N30_2516 [Sulfitobacter guttiformis]